MPPQLVLSKTTGTEQNKLAAELWDENWQDFVMMSLALPEQSDLGVYNCT